MCGVIGVASLRTSHQILYDYMSTMLQHRGQDAAGIVTLQDRLVATSKKMAWYMTYL